MNLKCLNTENTHANPQLGSANPQLKRGQGLTGTRTRGGCSATDAAKLHKGQLLSSQSTHPLRHKHTPGPPGRLDMLVTFSPGSSSLWTSADLTHTQKV